MAILSTGVLDIVDLKTKSVSTEGAHFDLDLDTVAALGVVTVAARGADDKHGAALAAARLVGGHCDMLVSKLLLVGVEVW